MLGLSETSAALRDTALAGLPVREGPAGALVVSGFDAGDPAALLRAWQASHALVPVTGRWPLLCATDGDDDVLEASPLDEKTRAELVELDRAARSVDPWTFFQPGDDVGAQQQLRAAYDHVLSDPGAMARVLERKRKMVSIERWYVPDGVALLLLPTALPWLAAYWMGFYGALEQDRELAAVLWQWYERWDVHPVASWDTILLFVVHRPPTPGDDAFTAAGQVLALSPNVSILQWELAAALPAGDAWFVHHRP